jgi:hypothetical protein
VGNKSEIVKIVFSVGGGGNSKNILIFFIDFQWVSVVSVKKGKGRESNIPFCMHPIRSDHFE